MKKIIHVNQHVIKNNAKNNLNDPVLTVKFIKDGTKTVIDDNKYAHELLIKDDNGNEVAKIVYSPDKPLSCGAKVYIETDKEVELK